MTPIHHPQDVDRALFNTLRLRFELGLFDPTADQPYWKLGAGAFYRCSTRVVSPENAAHQETIRVMVVRKMIFICPYIVIYPTFQGSRFVPEDSALIMKWAHVVLSGPPSFPWRHLSGDTGIWEGVCVNVFTCGCGALHHSFP